ncbi:MAG TPA: aldehyde dehydrogenase [Chitinophagales bacterium]|nr:aldehyde dehydrogenase [Chitinophagales bacterium]HNF20031.1 aldehyde dehydrogenase [Chitinophagales bacterium]HNF52413.1 aldehyde dehydrogenase [Chitinophagales bacterium]
MATKTISAIKSTIDKQRDYFESNATRDVDFRIQQLKNFKKALQHHESAIFEALQADFRKSNFETYATELGIIYDEVNCMLKHVKKWATPELVKDSIVNFPSRNYIYHDPYGVCLIIGAWNYPLQLTLAPVVGAIAAGNTCIIKPPRAAIHTYHIIEKIISDTFNDNYIAVLDEHSDNAEMLAHRYDYIFFTGGVEIGRTIARAAAEFLTPTTLELGGKSPCIVDKHADIEVAARRIAWGKYLNGGQTCVAPDYLLLHESVKEKFYKAFTKTVKEFYGNNPQDSADYPRIINDRHFKRIAAMITDGNIIVGGKTDAETRYISPTLIEIDSLAHPLMNDEIFGPVLPVLTINSIDDAIHIIKQYEKPLAFYLFSNNYSNQQKYLQTIQFGGGCINDTISHLANHELPFGGIGNSGSGAYHGKASFDTFSHKKSICHKVTWPDVPLRYPPYNGKLMLIKQVMK